MTRTLVFLLLASCATARTYYIDCTAGSDNASGDSGSSAWKSPGKVSATRFAAGDSILFRRATHCDGALWPKGSGEDGRPIRIGAYGSGPLPIINARNADAAIKLYDQQGWEIENLETSGGQPYGVFIGGHSDGVTRRHFVLRNLVVHGVSGALDKKASGLLVVSAPEGVTFEDILIDGVTAYGTSQWAGIYVSGSSSRARHVVVRNSIVHDVYGDGIVLFQTEDGRIEKSAAWHTGLQDKETIGTPNAIWTWTCRRCVVENNEGFWIDSPGVDGGVYDIDWANDDNVVQGNYGHDAQGYCVAIFGAGKQTTTNSTVRDNVCVNNGRSPKLARRQGDLFTMTWDGGSLDGVVIEHNTFIWNPPINAPAVHISETAFSGRRPVNFSQNLIYSSVPRVVSSDEHMQFDGNLYWHPGSEQAEWAYGARGYEGFESWKRVFLTDLFADPGLDWRLRPLHANADVGAVRGPEERAGRKKAQVPHAPGKWLLSLNAREALSDARSELVFVQAAIAQYRDKGLEAEVIEHNDDDLKFDWNLGDARLVKTVRSKNAPFLALISPAGEIVRIWNTFAPPANLGLTLKHYLGSAPGDPAVDIGRP